MKILWFSVTPLSLNAKENTGIEGKGWISSLLQIALAIDGLELVVVYENYSPHRKEIEETERLKNTYVGTSKKVTEFLIENNSTALGSGSSLYELISRPELDYFMIEPIDEKRQDLPDDVKEQVNINIKYAGYIEKQIKQVEAFKKMEVKKIPEDIDYNDITGLRNEARQKLISYAPVSIGQASRISGVSPADISVLLVYLKSRKL